MTDLFGMTFFGTPFVPLMVVLSFFITSRALTGRHWLNFFLFMNIGYAFFGLFGIVPEVTSATILLMIVLVLVGMFMTFAKQASLTDGVDDDDDEEEKASDARKERKKRRLSTTNEWAEVPPAVLTELEEVKKKAQGDFVETVVEYMNNEFDLLEIDGVTHDEVLNALPGIVNRSPVTNKVLFRRIIENIVLDAKHNSQAYTATKDKILTVVRTRSSELN